MTVSIGVGCYDEDSSCWIEPSAESRFHSEVACTSTDLVHSADKALYAAKRAGRAQAWHLDIGDVDAPGMAREIAPEVRNRRKAVTP